MCKESTAMNDISKNGFITQLRCSNELADRLRNYADETGSSMNSTICIAVDLWLRNINK